MKKILVIATLFLLHIGSLFASKDGLRANSPGEIRSESGTPVANPRSVGTPSPRIEGFSFRGVSKEIGEEKQQELSTQKQLAVLLALVEKQGEELQDLRAHLRRGPRISLCHKLQELFWSGAVVATVGGVFSAAASNIYNNACESGTMMFENILCAAS